MRTRTAIRNTIVGAIALSLTTAGAFAGIPSRMEAKKAVQQLKQSNKSIADIVKIAEQRSGGTAVAVTLESAPMDRSAPLVGTDGDEARNQDRTNENGKSHRANASKRGDTLEYRVTCLVDNSRLKDVYVCAESGEVKSMRNANEHSRWTRGHRGSNMADRSGMRNGRGGIIRQDRYADQNDRFSAGPDGYYERIVVWHFVPSDENGQDGQGSRSAHNNDHDESDIRTNYDPNAQNHHDRQVDGRYAQGSTNDNEIDRNNDRNHRNLNQPGTMVLGSNILNASATNSQGQDLGDVEDIVVNPEDGKVVYTAVAYGGLLGIGEKHFAISCEDVSRVGQDKIFLDVDKSELENKPGFKDNQWPKQADTTVAGNQARHTTTPAPVQIAKLSEIIGKDLASQQGETLGEIDNVVIDTSAGQVAYLIVDCADRDGKVAVPCGAVRMQNDKCVINMPKSRFSQLQTFDNDNYPSWTNAGWNERTHSEFNVKPYYKAQANATTNDRLAG